MAPELPGSPTAKFARSWQGWKPLAEQRDAAMLTQIKSPVPAGTGDPCAGKTSQIDHIRRPLKWKRVLTAFYAGRSLNRFQAERELHDHCLHTTASVLQGKGLTILRRDEVVPGFQNIPTHVCRYWLAPESRQRAADLLGYVGHQAAASEVPAGHSMEARHNVAPTQAWGGRGAP